MPREYRQTEKRIRADFWRDIAPRIPANDKPALRESFCIYLDQLHRDGALTDYQASRITLGPEVAPKAAGAIFLNWEGPQGRETVDSVEPCADWPNRRAMRKEAARLCREYAICGMTVYTSSRPCANWR